MSSHKTQIPRTLEPLALAAVPLSMAVCALLDIEATAGLTMLVVVLALLLVFAGYESSRPALRQVMPTVVLASLAAAGRVLLAPLPDAKPVSAIAIVAGSMLGRRNGFMVGALAALVSNAFLGQGAWTPWQMYAWGLVGYLAGVLADTGALRHRWVLLAYGFVSALLYGAILNGWYVLGFVRPLTAAGAFAGYAAAVPWDVVHGLATVGFLILIWLPWDRSIRRVLAKYDLAGGDRHDT